MKIPDVTPNIFFLQHFRCSAWVECTAYYRKSRCISRPPKIKHSILYLQWYFVLIWNLVYKSRYNNLARFVVSKTRLIHRDFRYQNLPYFWVNCKYIHLNQQKRKKFDSLFRFSIGGGGGGGGWCENVPKMWLHGEGSVHFFRHAWLWRDRGEGVYFPWF